MPGLCSCSQRRDHEPQRRKPLERYTEVVVYMSRCTFGRPRTAPHHPPGRNKCGYCGGSLVSGGSHRADSIDRAVEVESSPRRRRAIRCPAMWLEEDWSMGANSRGPDHSGIRGGPLRFAVTRSCRRPGWWSGFVRSPAWAPRNTLWGCTFSGCRTPVSSASPATSRRSSNNNCDIISPPPDGVRSVPHSQWRMV